MLAHWHGQVWNANAFARNFEVSAPTVRHDLDILTGTRVMRQLRPVHASTEPTREREIDLVRTLDARTRIAVEIKYSSAPGVSRGMRQGMEDLGCREGFVVTPAGDTYPVAGNIRVTPLARFLREVPLDRFGLS